MAHGAAVDFTFFAGICTFKPVTGLMTLCVAADAAAASLLSVPLSDVAGGGGGGGLSSFDLRFSARGARNPVGDVDGVLFVVLLPELLELPAFVAVDDVVVAVVVDVAFVAAARAALLLALAFRSLLCTCASTQKRKRTRDEKFKFVSSRTLKGGGGLRGYTGLTELRVSVKLLRSLAGCWAAFRPRLARPFGVRASSSSVGESQNLCARARAGEKKRIRNIFSNARRVCRARHLPRRCPIVSRAVEQRAHIRFSAPCDIHHEHAAFSLMPYNSLQCDGCARLARAQTVRLGDRSDRCADARIRHRHARLHPLGRRWCAVVGGAVCHGRRQIH